MKDLLPDSSGESLRHGEPPASSTVSPEHARIDYLRAD